MSIKKNENEIEKNANQQKISIISVFVVVVRQFALDFFKTTFPAVSKLLYFMLVLLLPPLLLVLFLISNFRVCSLPMALSLSFSLFFFCFAEKQFISVCWVYSKQNSLNSNISKYAILDSDEFRKKRRKLQKSEIVFFSRHSVDCCSSIIWKSAHCTTIEWRYCIHLHIYHRTNSIDDKKYVAYLIPYVYAQGWMSRSVRFFVFILNQKNVVKWNNKTVTFFSTTVPEVLDFTISHINVCCLFTETFIYLFGRLLTSLHSFLLLPA